MNFLPTTLGTRPRLAVELRVEGIVAARAESAAAVLSAVARAPLPAGVFAAGLRPGNLADRATVVAALRRVLEGVADKNEGRAITLVVPDAAVRVLLIDFDTLPAKAAEALPVVRFRLKKMLPFEADDASVSYQVMSSDKSGMRVLAVAMPREVLAEYESSVREAGFEPGAVLPSTLAALAGLEVAESSSLVVNASAQGVTTAIVQGGVLLLHRSVDMTTEMAEPATALAAGYEESEAARARAAVMAGPNAALDELTQAAASHEVAQAVSVAAAYFEDTLGAPPSELLAAGTLGAAKMGDLLAGDGLRVRELVEPQMVAAATAGVPLSWLAGVRGALKS